MRKLMLFFIGLLAFNIYSQDDFNKYLEWRNQAKKGYDTEINILPKGKKVSLNASGGIFFYITNGERKEQAFHFGVGYFVREFLETGFKITLSEDKWLEIMKGLEDSIRRDEVYQRDFEMINSERIFAYTPRLEGQFKKLNKNEITQINEILSSLENIKIAIKYEESQYVRDENVSTHKFFLVYVERGKPELSVEVIAPVQNLTDYIIKTYK